MSKVIIKNTQQIRNLEDSGKYLTELLNILYDFIKPGVRLIDIEQKAENYINFYNLKWAFKGYYWYPANLCLSVNDCVVHGIPDDYILKEWDLLKVDCGIQYKWMITDAAFSIVVWWDEKNKRAKHLHRATKRILDEAILFLVPGKSLYEYSKKAYNIAKDEWISIIRNLTWHWVWSKLHEPPLIYNYPNAELKKYIIKPWMTVAIEPITAEKSKYAVEIKGIPWNMYTEKWDLWAQWEYTILITDNWPKIIAGLSNN